jgi:hypothetical protein
MLSYYETWTVLPMSCSLIRYFRRYLVNASKSAHIVGGGQGRDMPKYQISLKIVYYDQKIFI